MLRKRVISPLEIKKERNGDEEKLEYREKECTKTSFV
jgi:hypothetical protein